MTTRVPAPEVARVTHHHVRRSAAIPLVVSRRLRAGFGPALGWTVGARRSVRDACAKAHAGTLTTEEWKRGSAVACEGRRSARFAVSIPSRKARAETSSSREVCVCSLVDERRARQDRPHILFLCSFPSSEGHLYICGEFDPGSGLTLAACFTNASRTRWPSGRRVAAGCVTRG